MYVNIYVNIYIYIYTKQIGTAKPLIHMFRISNYERNYCQLIVRVELLKSNVFCKQKACK